MKKPQSFMHSLCITVLVTGWGVAAAQSSPEPLGTLLFSPQERAQITTERNSDALGPDAPAAILKYQGLVRRSVGKSTVWVNDQALVHGDAKAPAMQGSNAILAGHALRVGESVQATTGQRQDVTAPGAVTVRRSR